ncbi:MAG: SusC/RagA family TonB-linked outer membrane protein [Bacteroidales bacterium]|nr:SusC/RagA family TonB-linked outer membrane protein [Bacteroidales bacterium]
MWHSRILLTLIIFLLPVCVVAQKKVVGNVVDTDRNPLPGVAVRIVESKLGTVTDVDGNYQLVGVYKGAVIEFSFLGMTTRTIKYKGEQEIDVVLTEDATQLDEVVVSAKTNINEIDIRARSGVVQSIDVKRVEEKPMIDMGLALQGSVPGLSIINTGDLGSVPEIRIRGNSSLRKGNATNEPLYVMDGQVITAETFYNLNSSDIQDIKVLKDAAACALYGIKAANGVLEITTKRGYEGKTSVNYNMNIGVTARGRRGIEMMSSAEKLELERLIQNPETPGYRYSADYYNRFHSTDPNLQNLIREGEMKLDSLRNINTDWFDELLHTSLYQKHNLSLKGGSSATSYYVSANYTQQGGRIPGNDKHRMSMRLNLDQRLGDIGYLMMSVNGGYSKTNTPNGTTNDPASLVYDLNPYEQKVGELWSNPGRTYSDLMNQFSEEGTDTDAGATASLTITPVSGLDIAAVGGVNFSLAENHQFTPSTAYTETHSGIPEEERGIYSKSKLSTINISSNVRITYSKTFNDKHDFTIGANTDYYMTSSDNVLMRGYGVGTINSAAAINQSLQGNRQPYVSGLRDKSAQIGIGIVSGYTYDGTYDLFATYKLDASSLLPSDKRWNSAWAVGAGWTPSQYKFFKRQRVLTALNLKASYGYMANLNGVSISSTVASFAYSTSKYENQRPLDLLALYNSDLKPEQTKSIDAGLSMQFFKRLTIDVNWYNRKTEDALLDVPIPASTGYTSLKRNIGSLQNQGVELSLNAKLVDLYNWTFIIGANMAYNHNKVLDLYYTDKIYTSDESIVPDYEVGKSYDMLYGPYSLGINPLTGYPVFLLPDGTEKQATEVLKPEDVIALGYSTPPYTGSFNLTLTYKSFDLDVDFYYSLGGIQRYNYSYVRTKDDIHKNAVAGQTENMWFRPGDQDKLYPTPFYTSTTAENNISLYPNSLTVGSSNYLRLSLISLRYRVPPKWLEKHIKFVKYANFAFQASNLFTWTKYSESDPESGTLAGTLQPVYTINMSLTF